MNVLSASALAIVWCSTVATIPALALDDTSSANGVHFAAGASSSTRYVGTAPWPYPVGNVQGFYCAGPISNPEFPQISSGGACKLKLARGPNEVSVTDDVLGDVNFTYIVENEEGSNCAVGRALGRVVVMADECERLSLTIDAPATTGIITVRAMG